LYGQGLKLKNSTTDWEFLRSKLQYKGRWQPLYNTDFHLFLESLNLIPKPYKSSLKEEFIDSIDKWILGSKLNNLKGLASFPHRDVIQGVTQQIEDLCLMKRENLCVLKGEFHYSRSISISTREVEVSEIKRGDHVLISLPFSNSGLIHFEMSNLIEKVEKSGAFLHIDCAWLGCCRGISFDFSSLAIGSVSFSLSKSLGLGAHRIGIRYSREREAGMVTTLNDQNYLLDSPMWSGLKAMERFGVDYLQNRYYPIYKMVCERYNFEETNTIFVAIDPSYEWLQGVGLRPVLRFIDEGKW
jgi:hypothetical protein